MSANGGNWFWWGGKNCTPDELKRLVPGGHIRLRFADAESLDKASHLLTESSRDDEGLALTVPSDGGVNALRGGRLASRNQVGLD